MVDRIQCVSVLWITHDQPTDDTDDDRTVPAGTYLEFKGIDIISVDLDTRLVYNATSSGDWINLARELGQIGNFFP